MVRFLLMYVLTCIVLKKLVDAQRRADLYNDDEPEKSWCFLVAPDYVSKVTFTEINCFEKLIDGKEENHVN